MEALLRYEQGRLPRTMKLWVEKLLELNTKDEEKLLPEQMHY